MEEIDPQADCKMSVLLEVKVGFDGTSSPNFDVWILHFFGETQHAPKKGLVRTLHSALYLQNIKYFFKCTIIVNCYTV